MQKTALFLLLTCLNITSYYFNPRNQMQYSCFIQFPTPVAQLPDIRVYCGGNILSCQTDNVSKRIAFTIPQDRTQTTLTMVVAQPNALKAIMDENTVKYWTIKPGKSYKFYVLTLKEIPSEKAEEGSQFQWIVKETTIPFINRRIPDDCIIVCYNPQFIDSIAGGNAVQLPTIKIASNVLSITGSEQQFDEQSRAIFMSAIDYDALHGKSKQMIKPHYDQKTILTLTA